MTRVVLTFTLFISLCSYSILKAQNTTSIELNVGRSLSDFKLNEHPEELNTDGKGAFGFGIKRNITYANRTFLKLGAAVNVQMLEGERFGIYHGAWPTPNSPHVKPNRPFLVSSKFTSSIAMISLPVQYGLSYKKFITYLGPSISYIFLENYIDIDKTSDSKPFEFQDKFNISLDIGIAYFFVPEFAVSVDYMYGLNKLDFECFEQKGKAKLNSLSIGLKMFIKDKKDSLPTSN